MSACYFDTSNFPFMKADSKHSNSISTKIIFFFNNPT